MAGRGPGVIAFSRGTGLYAIDADGTHLRRLAAVGDAPAWSPDGRRMVYLAPYQDVMGLRILALGGRSRLLAPVPSDGNADCCDYASPVWSPDGKLIAFSYVTDPGTRQAAATIAVMPAAGGATVVLTKGPGDVEPSWAPGSNALAFGNPSWIMRVGVHGGSARLLVQSNGPPPDSDGQLESRPAWSRTGRIAFAAPRGIEVVNADGRGRRFVARVSGAQSPVWSPNGKLLAFETVKRGLPAALYVVGADGSKLQRLTKRGQAGVHPSWSPDGSAVVYVATTDGTEGSLVVVSVDGKQMKVLTRSQTDAQPAWQPR